MTRSIFDPTGGETEHSGSRNLGRYADDLSQIPPDVVDGKASEEEIAEMENAAPKSPDQSIEDGTRDPGQDVR